MGEWMAESDCKWPDVYIVTINSLFGSLERKVTDFWIPSFQGYYAYPYCLKGL